jgi:hypothetical protein
MTKSKNDFHLVVTDRTPAANVPMLKRRSDNLKIGPGIPGIDLCGQIHDGTVTTNIKVNSSEE